MRAVRLKLGLLALPLAMACGASETGEVAPPPLDLPLAPTGALAAASVESPAKQSAASIAWGRYKGPSTCLELFANGDAHLNADTKGPKVQAMGTLRMGEADAQGVVPAQFEVRRVWQARWVSACRKNHTLGTFTESMRTLGHDFVKGSHELRIRQLDDGGLELCAKACERLARRPTVLHGQWRTPELRGSEEIFNAAPGQPLELKLRDGNSSGLWLSLGPERHWAMLTGTAEVSVLEGRADHFKVSFEVGMVDTGAGVMAEPDSEWHEASRVELSAERLPQEKLRVCRLGDASTAKGACSVLERRFDGFDYEVH